MAKSPLLTGAQVVCYINGSICGKVASFNWDSQTPRRFIQTIDTLVPVETVPLPTSIVGTVGIYRIHGDGGAEGLGMVAPNGYNELEKYFTIMILDRTNDMVIFQADNCSVMSQSWAIQRGYVMGQIQFRAMTWNNETSMP